MHSERIDWNRTLFKTYYEKRSFGHLLINFSYILVLWHPAAQHVLASIVGEHTVKLWDLGTPKSPCAVLTGHGDRIQRLAFYSTGQLLATTSRNCNCACLIPTQAEKPPASLRAVWHQGHRCGLMETVVVSLQQDFSLESSKAV
ncbi:hypothetical protein BGY98DRAFT_632608 [Russula aff. rugulosa BPL654]|nr:hypothetical protein BGY98DRAFT_632608 [Russula aff. rugulosa BPL654]